MAIPIDVKLVEAYSRGEISRREITDDSGAPVSFGRLLASLHVHQLRLPRFPSDPDSEGVALIRRLSERGTHAG